jgi:hypothetical protein
MVQSVVGEESGGCGTLANIVKGYHADAAMILEPTSFKDMPHSIWRSNFSINNLWESYSCCNAMGRDKCN